MQPKRIVILTIGTFGDVRPYVALGIGLQNAGHRVRIATHEIYEPLVRQHGLDFAPLHGNPMELLQSARGDSVLHAGKNPLAFIRGFSGLGTEIFHSLFVDTQAACRGTDFIMVSLTCFFIAGFHAAQSLNIPYCGTFLAPVHQTTDFANPLFPQFPNLPAPIFSTYNRLSHYLAIRVIWLVLKAQMNRNRQQVMGLPPIKLSDILREVHDPNRLSLYGFSPIVVPPPSDWGAHLHVTGYWDLPDDPTVTLSEPLQRFLDAGDPPVYVGFGSMANADSAAMTQTVVEALRMVGRRGILLTGWGALNPVTNDDKLICVENVPHHVLFPRVAAAVHHAGQGTTAASLKAGIPTVTVPFFAEQPFWASRVHELGAGPAPIPRGRMTPKRLADALDRALNDSAIRQRAAEVGQALRQEDGVSQAVTWFDQHVS